MDPEDRLATEPHGSGASVEDDGTLGGEHGGVKNLGPSIAIVTVLAALTALAGCAQQRPDLEATPSTVASESVTTATAAETPSAAPTESASGLPSSGAKVDASGSLSLYSEVSTELSGSCQEIGGVPTVEVEDGANDFFEQVQVKLLLSGDRAEIDSLTISLASDSEGIAWQIGVGSAVPGTSADLVVKGDRLTISGKALAALSSGENQTVPYKLVLTCAGTW